MDAPLPTGTLKSLNLSDGGVPKRPVREAQVGWEGLEGDRQNDRRHHGGPERALCLFGREVIERLATEGHPLGPGSTGENLTLSGLDWAQLVPGCRLRFEGGVELQATSYVVPCATIRPSFKDGLITRISAREHPGESRIYARVLTCGILRQGERCTLLPADAAHAEDGTTDPR